MQIDNISKETFREMPDSDKLNIIYDCMCLTHDRLKKLEDRKLWDTATSTFGGVVGGMVAIFTKMIIWK